MVNMMAMLRLFSVLPSCVYSGLALNGLNSALVLLISYSRRGDMGGGDLEENCICSRRCIADAMNVCFLWCA